jgi:hypothetical protein
MLERPLHDQEAPGLPVDAEVFTRLSLAGRGRTALLGCCARAWTAHDRRMRDDVSRS